MEGHQIAPNVAIEVHRSLLPRYILTSALLVQERVRQQQRSTKVGKLRPDIVLYEEVHPLAEDIGRVQQIDLESQPNLLIVMVTSLQVPGIKKLVKTFAVVVHASKSLVIFVNKTPPTKEWENIFDYHIEGEADEWVASLPQEVTDLARRLSSLQKPRFVTSTFLSKKFNN
jgi:NAD-dependent SIR2 family protein deacetylase